MARPLPLLLAISAGFAAAAACYSDRQPPPTFRYSCDADADCSETERCMEGLCQVPCTQATFSDVCLGANHLTCFNGVCSTGCQPTEDDACPSSQECIELGLTVAGGGFIGGGTQTMLGICGTLCTDTSCPEGEDCVFGLCAVPCTSTDECPEGLSCTMGYCVPGGGETDGSDGGDDSGASDEMSTNDTTAADSTATGGGT